MPFLVINIPGSLMPMERGERFEDPLQSAFAAEGIEAAVVGGGSSLKPLEGRVTITGCDIDLDVADVAKSLPVIRRILIAPGSPSETIIRQNRPEKVVYRLHDA